MRHERRMVDKAFHAAKAFRQREQLRVLEKTPRSGKVRFQNDRDHAAETEHLLTSQIVVRMRFEAGIMDRFDLCSSSQRAISSPLAQCRSIRSASVFKLRKTRKLSNAPAIAPTEFCKNAI